MADQAAMVAWLRHLSDEVTGGLSNTAIAVWLVCSSDDSAVAVWLARLSSVAGIEDLLHCCQMM